MISVIYLWLLYLEACPPQHRGLCFASLSAARYDVKHCEETRPPETPVFSLGTQRGGRDFGKAQPLREAR